MDTATPVIPKVKTVFVSTMLVVFVVFFTLGITFRQQEVAFLAALDRFTSTVGYSLQYALFAGGNRSVAGSGFALAVPEATSAGEAQAIPVLLYHGIVPQADRFSLREETFKDQLFALKRAGYQTVSLEDFRAFMAGEKSLPERSFLLTFDDGRRDSYQNADPLLDVLDYTAVMFVATQSSLGTPTDHKSYYLNEDDLHRMVASGRWELASHAKQETGGYVPTTADQRRGNFLSSKRWLVDAGRLETDTEYADRVERELQESKTALEELSAPIIAFSYPFGDYGQQTENYELAGSVIRDVVSETYDLSFRQVWPLDPEYTYNYPGEEMHRLKRVEVATDMSGRELLAFLEGALPKPLPYEDPLTSTIGWKYNWGEIRSENDTLILAADENSAGAFAFLDGTRTWSDYRLVVGAERRPGTSFSLIARYTNAESYASCTFGDGILSLEQRVNGTTQTLREVAASVPVSGTFTLEAQGSVLTCGVGTESISATIDEQAGGIGLRVWSEPLATARTSITSLRVEAAP
ncbi:MAG TPA: polysaccharide deacetylase family protein [Candidatus Paceibacterota bacterium]|nr:polysaccharide deacetylase family protein [Candidatus Paceibacterota bacterium]